MPSNFLRRKFAFYKSGLTLLVAGLSILVTSCGQAPTTQTLLPPTIPPISAVVTAPANSPTIAPTEASPAGDVPDNAVFVTYSSPSSAYSIQYVESWTVAQQPNDSVLMTDIDSAEAVTMVATPSGDLTHYVSTTDEPQLEAQVKDYKRVDLKTVQVHNQPVVVLSYTSTSAPDPFTGKSRAVTSLRYFMSGSKGKLAILTLTTPPEVDNVDAFNQILGSFTWTS